MNRLILLVLAALLVPGLAFADRVSQRKRKKADVRWKKDFRRRMSHYDIDVRKTAVEELLKPFEEKDRFAEILGRVLKDPDWSVRRAGQKAIGEVESEDRIEQAIEALRNDKDPLVREGVVVGLGLREDEDLIPSITEALQDKDIFVRVSAARALGELPCKESIDALLAVSEAKDQDARVLIAVQRSLEKVTGSDPKVRDERYAASDVRLDFRVQGNGIPLVVLPEFGYTGKYMEDYLGPLAETAQVRICCLPTLSAFENLKRGRGDTVQYPVEQVCNALKEWSAANKLKRFGLIAHQRSCWVAMRLASLYPQYIAQMILVCPNSGAAATFKALERCARLGKAQKNPDLQHLAESQLRLEGEPSYRIRNQEEFLKFRRLRFTLWFDRRSDTTIGLLYRNLERPPNDIEGAPLVEFFSGFELHKERRAPVPTLIIWGQRTPYYSADDVKKIGKFYPNSRVHVFQKSAHVPFIEEHEAFHALVRKFIESSRKRKR